MEAILTIIGLIIVWNVGWAILKGLFNAGVNKVAPDSSLAKRAHPDPFSIKVVKKKKDFRDTSLDVFSVSFKGLVEIPRDNIDCCFILLMKDVTDKTKPGFIVSSIEELQEEKSVLFQYISAPETIPYEYTIFSKYADLIDIPIDFLQFPKKGARKIEFMLILANSTNCPRVEYGAVVSNKQYIYAIETVEFGYTNNHPGYEDLKQYSKEIDELTIRLAMYVSASDGDLHESEGKVIRNWLEKKIYSERLSEDEIKNEKLRFNGYVKQAYKEAEGGLISIGTCTDRLNEISSVAERYEILELCMQVASADGIAEGKELDVVKDMAKRLSLDMGRIREMQDKILPISMHAIKTDEESLIGITSDMSPNEIRKHLSAEYRKWNSQVTHSDENIRKQADEMIKVIAKLRAKLVG